MILGDKSIIFEVVLSHPPGKGRKARAHRWLTSTTGRGKTAARWSSVDGEALPWIETFTGMFYSR
jgi:hypothetical protein